MCALCDPPIKQPIYCERRSTDLFAEPLNAGSNLCFFLFAWLASRSLNKRGIRDPYLHVLTYLLALVGLGSLGYHTFPQPFTLALDAVPIYIFILASLAYLLRRLILSWLIAWSACGVFIVLQIIVTVLVPSSFAGGSIRHLVSLVIIAALVVACYIRWGTIALWLLPVMCLYGLAIWMRSIDMATCSALPAGTHFLWHILAAAAGYSLIAFLGRLAATLQGTDTDRKSDLVAKGW